MTGNIAFVKSAVDELKTKVGEWEIIRDRDNTGTCVYTKFYGPDGRYVKTYSWLSDDHRNEWLPELLKNHVDEFCSAVGRLLVLGEV